MDSRIDTPKSMYALRDMGGLSADVSAAVAAAVAAAAVAAAAVEDVARADALVAGAGEVALVAPATSTPCTRARKNEATPLPTAAPTCLTLPPA